jgi:hypothetical protein
VNGERPNGESINREEQAKEVERYIRRRFD